MFGCGGDRDPAKRPLMGAVAARLADHVVVTSDNPRSEEPDAIIEPDPARACRATTRRRCSADRADGDRRRDRTRRRRSDVVLIAGKGHEDYQEIAGTTHRRSPTTASQRAARCDARATRA